MEKIRFILNGQEIETDKGSTILEAARENGVNIPTLCYLKGVNAIGSCRMCVVEVKGAKGPMPACVTKVSSGMEVSTDSETIIEARKRTLELICSQHRFDCDYCQRYSDCELHALMRIYGVDEKRLEYGESRREAELDESAVHLVRDLSKCVQCRRCVNTCAKTQGIQAIAVLGRGADVKVRPALTLDLDGCVHCGQCIAVCPTGALAEKDNTGDVWHAINNKDIYVVAAVSPYAAAAFGECLLFQQGIPGAGKLAAALRRIGFDAVYDEGAYQLTDSLTEQLKYAQNTVLSGACPSFIRLCEIKYPELTPLVENHWELFAKKCRQQAEAKADGKKIYVVSILPCTADKKAIPGGGADVSITTNEAASMFRKACVSRFTARSVWQRLPEEEFDSLPFLEKNKIGISVYGGLLENAIKTLANKNFSFGPADEQGVSQAIYYLNGQEKRAALVITGLANAQRLLDRLQRGEEHFDAVEIMACPGGCLSGGGQPRVHAEKYNFGKTAEGRASALCRNI